MKRLAIYTLLIVTLVSATNATSRQALGEEERPQTARVARANVLLARSASGIEVWKFNGSEWRRLPDGPALGDAGGWDAPQYYSTIQTADIDGDSLDELLARSASGIHAWKYEAGGWQQLPDGPALSDAAGWHAPEYYSTIQTGDVDGDARDELLARSASGIHVWEYVAGGWQQLPDGPALSDAAGWNAPEYYSTIQTANIDATYGDELLARSAGGIEAWQFDGSSWQQLANGPPWSDANGWHAPQYYSTIQTDRIDSASVDSLLARSASGIELWWFASINWQQYANGPAWSDAAGWNAPEYYSTIQIADINDTSWGELLARSASGIVVWHFFYPDWEQLPDGPALSDAAGWNAPEYYSTIQTADIDGDGQDGLLARSAGGIEAWQFDGSSWQQLANGPPWSDANGWHAPQYYSTMQTADILPRTYLPIIHTRPIVLTIEE